MAEYVVMLGSPKTLIATRQQLLARGFTPRQLAAAVKSGRLLRVRRGYYARPTVHPLIRQAVCAGGLATCVSAAAVAGLWVPNDAAHIYLRHEASRLRRPSNRYERLTETNRDGCTLHWWPLHWPETASMHSVGVKDALAHVIRCQPPALAVAVLDSALHQRAVDRESLAEVFSAVPQRYRSIRHRVDGRAMSGLETLVRLMVIDAGLDCQVQVTFDGVGTVDLVVEGCVVVETDGKLGHADAVGSARDYRRDAALVARGYTVLRFDYRQVMFEPDAVLAAIRAAVAAHRRGELSRRQR